MRSQSCRSVWPVHFRHPILPSKLPSRSLQAPFSTTVKCCEKDAIVHQEAGILYTRIPNANAMLQTIIYTQHEPFSPQTPPKRMILSSHKVRQVPLEALTLELESFDAVDEELVTIALTGAFDTEDEVIANPAKHNLVLELIMSKTLARDGVFHGVVYNGFLLSGGLVVDQFDDTPREAAGELLGVSSQDRLFDVDGWK